jgi:hypothetical protein
MEEIKRLKEAEEEALSIALGNPPKKKPDDGTGGEGSGSNSIPVNKELDEAEKEARRKEKL